MTATSYAVQPGDSLWSIAQQATSRTAIDAAAYWAELVRLNREAVGNQHRLDRPGTMVALPDPHLL
ncbi:MAG: LysM domain-containing protein [Actinomycetota bacterium]|nr:LysM domain-containing protein [Actinomycetota bacterium]